MERTMRLKFQIGIFFFLVKINIVYIFYKIDSETAQLLRQVQPR